MSNILLLKAKIASTEQSLSAIAQAMPYADGRAYQQAQERHADMKKHLDALKDELAQLEADDGQLG